jgi:hypothetical protein
MFLGAKIPDNIFCSIATFGWAFAALLLSNTPFQYNWRALGVQVASSSKETFVSLETLTV